MQAASPTSKRYMRGEHEESSAPATKSFRCRRCHAVPRWVVLLFPDSLPTFEYSPSRGKSPLCQQNDHFKLTRAGFFRYSVPRAGGRPRDRSSRGVMSMKVHDDQSEVEKTGPTPLRYSPTVLVSTLLESWPIKGVWGGREYGADRSLGRIGGWGGRESGANK